MFLAIYGGAQPRPYSLSLFGELHSLWQAWQNGITPLPGGAIDQEPNLLTAFGVLSAAEARAQAATRPKPRG